MTDNPRSKGQETSAALAVEKLYKDLFGASPTGMSYHYLCASIDGEVRSLRELNEDQALLIKALKEANEMWDKKSREEKA